MHVSVLFMRCIPAGQKNSPSNNDHKSNTFFKQTIHCGFLPSKLPIATLAAAVVYSCIHDCRTCATGGLIQNEWETLGFITALDLV